ALGVLLVGPKDLIEIGEFHLSWERGDGRCTLRWHRIVLLPSPISLFSRHHHILRLFIVAEPDKNRLPEESIARDLLVPHIAHELRLHPDMVGAFRKGAVLGRLAGRRLTDESLKRRADLVQLRAGESRPRSTTIDQRAVFVGADMQRPEAAARALGFCETDHDKVVDPVGANL